MSTSPPTPEALTREDPPYRTLTVTPVTKAIGAEIEGVDLREPLSPETLSELKRALCEHLVIFLRGQDLSDEQHMSAAANFGTLNVYPLTRARGLDMPLEFIEDGPESPPKTDMWHTDAAFMEEPPDLAMINIRVVPPSGGDTLWCSLYGAYEALSVPMREAADALEQDLHPGVYFKQTAELQFGPGIYEKVADEFQGVRHPLVRVHPETGRRALFLCGTYVQGIAGMHSDESTLLYEFFRSRLADPNLQCRWRWREHDVAIWDERCTNHRGLSDHHPSHRLVRRCTMGGGRPVGPVKPAGPRS